MSDTNDQTVFNTQEVIDAGKSDTPVGDTPTSQPQNAIPDMVADLVGEGKKYKDIPTALQALKFSQEHISNLENEHKELREELEKRVAVEDALRKLREESLANAGSSEDTPPAEGLDEGLLDERINQAISERERTERVKANIKEVDSRLKEVYGDKAAQTLASKAEDMGLTVAQLKELAGTSPSAIYSMFGIEGRKNAASVQNYNSSVNTSAMGTMGEGERKGQSYYSKMRREDPTKYFSPRIQLEMITKRKELGDDFYKY